MNVLCSSTLSELGFAWLSVIDTTGQDIGFFFGASRHAVRNRMRRHRKMKNEIRILPTPNLFKKHLRLLDFYVSNVNISEIASSLSIMYYVHAHKVHFVFALLLSVDLK